jgi:hypothetical protein
VEELYCVVQANNQLEGEGVSITNNYHNPDFITITWMNHQAVEEICINQTKNSNKLNGFNN